MFQICKTSVDRLSLELLDCIALKILPWLPIAFLVIFIGPNIYSTVRFQSTRKTTRNSQNNSLDHDQWTPFQIAKFALMICLVLIQSTLLGLTFLDNDNGQNGQNIFDLMLGSARVVTFGVVLGLAIWAKTSRMNGISSGFQFIFWFLSWTTEVYPFYSKLQLKISNSPNAMGGSMTSLQIVLDALNVFILLSLICVDSCSPIRTTETQSAKGSKKSSVQNKNGNQNCPELNASFPSNLLFSYYTSLIWRSGRQPLVEDDLWDLNPRDKSEELFPNFENCSKKSYSILKKLVKMFWPNLCYGAFMKLCQDLQLLTLPMILKGIIEFREEDQLKGHFENWKGGVFLGLLFVVTFGHTLASSQHAHTMLLIGMRVKTVLSNSMFTKSLTISNNARKEFSAGEIMNLVSIDIPRIIETLPTLNFLWSAPLQIGLCGVLLWQILGVSTLAILGLIIILAPISGLLIFKLRRLQFFQMTLKDERIMRMNKIISGIKVLKMYAWEPPFEDEILRVRNNELTALRKSSSLSAGLVFIWTCTPFLVSVTTFTTYVLIDETNILDAQTAFVSLTLFNILRIPLSTLPTAINGFVQASVSFKRITNYLDAEDKIRKEIIHNSSNADSSDNGSSSITMENCNFFWDLSAEVPTLKNMNIKIKKDDLICVMGAIGSGKSSLLTAVFGEIDQSSGEMRTVGSIAYHSQEVWLQNTSVQKNILFGSSFDLVKYKRTIEACELIQDINRLPFGDQTLIGDKGITLSGGQKQRISLARAIYRDADIYLLDDPLSAVDGKVGKLIFMNVLGPSGLLKEKIRIITTNCIKFISKADKIILLQNGKIRHLGTYTDLLERKNSFYRFIKHHTTTKTQGQAVLTSTEWTTREKLNSNSIHGQRNCKTSREPNYSRFEDFRKVDLEQIEEVEFTREGSVLGSVYLYYMKVVGWRIGFGAILLHIVYQGFSTASNFWLLDWSTSNVPSGSGNASSLNNQNENPSKRNLYLGVYIGLGFGQALSILVGSIVLVFGTLRAANILHSQTLRRVLKAPMIFFDTTSGGRILNRFSKDLDICDTMLARNFRSFLICFLYVLACLGIICYSMSNWIFLGILLPAIFFHISVQRLYVRTARQLKRLLAVTQSPIYSHFAETLSGRSTIVAFGVQNHFNKDLEQCVDRNNVVYFNSLVAERWLTIRLEMMGNVLVLCATAFILYLTDLSSGLIGLSLSSAFEIIQSLNILMRMLSDVESNMVSVERIKEYMQIDQEADWLSKPEPPKNWPESGSIIYENYKASYRKGLDNVLNGISFQIDPGEKIGIVGRTGSGKSSLLLALLRILEGESGSIKIDGQDISSIGLHYLRRSISIIPQDPVLFAGTLRTNLDPLKLHSDENIWRSLELAHLKSIVVSLPGGLEYEFGEDGVTFSSGQRQLLCLARILLRKTKILVIDEATSTLDLSTDELIQDTICNEFRDSTVLTIAHRLNSILTSSRIMVLDSGKICEFDTPANLIKNKASIFHSMVKSSGVR